MARERYADSGDSIARRSQNFVDWVKSLSAPQYDGLRWTDELLLNKETVSALQLIAHGRRILLGTRPMEEEVDALFSVLSLGVERLLKVALGHAHLRRLEGWPGFLESHGHRLSSMHRALLRKVERGIPEGTYPEDVRAELQRVREDRVLAALFDALESYGNGGRYQGLDGLAKTESRGEGAFDGYVGVLLAVKEVHSLPEDPDGSEVIARSNAIIERALREWLASLSRFARNDTLGLRARGLAADIHWVESTVGEREEPR